MAPLDTSFAPQVPYPGKVYSHRLDWDLPPNRLSAAIAAKHTAGVELLDLTEANPTSAGFEYSERTLTALADPRSLLYQPAAFGLTRAREAVASSYASVAPDQVVLTASTSEAYSWLFKLLCDPGDEILTPRPSYPLFEFLAKLELVEAVQYPMYYYGGWHIDTDGIASAVTARTRAIVLVNPNNPTGSYLKRSELARLAAICGEHGLALISDEVFAQYPLTDDAERADTIADVDAIDTFAMSGLSKAAGLPQMKLGWIVVNGPNRGSSLHRLEQIADTFLSVGAPVQHALPVLLADAARLRQQIGQRTRNNLEHLRQVISGSACGLLEIEGGWYATLQVPRTRAEEQWVLDLLERYNVLVQPGYFYDFAHEAFLVLSLLTPPPIFREGVSRLLELVTRTEAA